MYVQKYIDWNTGLEMAMHDAMSRICYRYNAALPSDSFRQFGRRTADGTPIWYVHGRKRMTPCAYQLMQMQSLTSDMEDMILFEVQKNDNALARIRQMGVALDEQQEIGRASCRERVLRLV